ncbi:DUF4381 domain-containing protein [Dyella sp. C11]|uniref:DUF4381 domain-containing protein n=1 Tax=Dyella sp. C11 TaxID=2126991 RepID=UPI000D647284|nr:DUF4381 domain-containing protein [Dyella sp. C11]
MNAPAAAQPNGPLLRDIHLPPHPSWWPLAPGWWGLAALGLILLALAVWWWRLRHRRRVAEQRVLAEVDRMLALWRDQPQALATGLHQLLRRAAVRLNPHAAQQRGEEWRQTLASLRVDTATLDHLRALDAAMFQPHATLDPDAAAHATRRWLQLAWREGVRSGPRARAALPVGART